MARVFFSYRRVDSKWAVGRLYDRLSEVLDRNNLFLDVSDIEPGEDYVDKIERIVGSCDVLLAVIGPRWLTSQDSSGRRRLDDPRDWVRVEIATALNRGIRVIPILIDDAPMPERHELPDELVGLSRRNAKLVSFTHFHADLDSLLRVLDKVLKSSIEPNSRQVETGTAVNENDKTTTSEESKRTELPMTICLETEGGVATPLIYKGSKLPAQESQVFSTAEDNQKAVTVTLVWGERSKAADNLSLGTFNLEGIKPANRGVPQIEISTSVDTNLIMTVTAKEKETGRAEVLDAVDLSRVEIPEEMQKEAMEKPRRGESERDADDIFKNFNFGDFDFGQLFRTPSTSGGRTRSGQQPLDVNRFVRISTEDAESGKEIDVKNGRGDVIRVKIPAGISDGTKVRCKGQGSSKGTRNGDLYINVKIDDKID